MLTKQLKMIKRKDPTRLSMLLDAARESVDSDSVKQEDRHIRSASESNENVKLAYFKFKDLIGEEF
jgi:hypothetical protein